jgi:hypothetical protein
LYKSGDIEGAKKVLKNIEAITPYRAIHTDYVHSRPEFSLITGNHDPKYVSDQLKLDKMDYDNQAHRAIDLQMLIKFLKSPQPLELLFSGDNALGFSICIVNLNGHTPSSSSSSNNLSNSSFW